MMVLHINGQQRRFEQTEISIATLIHLLNLKGKRLAIERNGEIVPRGLFAETTLATEDRLEIVGAVGGG
jgi:sulfur carrier protein